MARVGVAEGQANDQENSQNSQKNTNHYSSFPMVPLLTHRMGLGLKRGKSIPFRIHSLVFPPDWIPIDSQIFRNFSTYFFLIFSPRRLDAISHVRFHRSRTG
jgi:hypothetical protein